MRGRRDVVSKALRLVNRIQMDRFRVQIEEDDLRKMIADMSFDQKTEFVKKGGLRR